MLGKVAVNTFYNVNQAPLISDRKFVEKTNPARWQALELARLKHCKSVEQERKNL